MSCYFIFSKETSLTVPSVCEKAGIIYYEINVKVNNIEWFVTHRYSEFDDLHKKIITEQGVSKTLLPAKKMIGNRNPDFIEQRRKLLENYLQNLLTLLRVTMPICFAKFLDFNKYDVIYLLQDLAKKFFEEDCKILRTSCILSALELFAISERIQLPCVLPEYKLEFDFSHVLDFCSKLNSLCITPITMENGEEEYDCNTADVPIGRSNLIPKNLKFNLNAFRNLKEVKIYGIPPENITDISLVKITLESLYVHNTTITKVNQIFACDYIHKNEMNSMTPWKALEHINFSNNLIKEIDSSIKLASKLKTIIFDRNHIKTISNLNSLSHLETLSLKENIISECIDWHTKLGNLHTLNISQNKFKNISGLRKLYSLISLDLSMNLIEDIDEIDHIGTLPLLENINLIGNPIACTVDYRSRVLSRFMERAPNILLDNEKGSAEELDMALVLSALHQPLLLKHEHI